MSEMSDSHKPDAAQTQAGYDLHAHEFADAYEGRADLEQISAFTEHVLSGGTIIDVGCAAGRDTAIFDKQGFKAIGVDLSSGLLEEAKKRHPALEFVQADMRHLPFADQSVDGVWSRASLVHMEETKDTVDALSEFFRVLKPLGTLSIRVKARKKGEPETGHESDKLSGGTERFFRYFTPEEITGYARQVGLAVSEAKIYNEANRADQMRDKSTIRDIDWLIFMARKPVSLSNLVSAAGREDRDTVDASLEASPDDPRYLEWALANLTIASSNFRDLAASIIERAPVDSKMLEGDKPDFRDEWLAGLEEVMTGRVDHPSLPPEIFRDAPYLPARFHAALAVIKHGRDSAEARKVIDEATQSDDEELKKMAEQKRAELPELEKTDEDTEA